MKLSEQWLREWVNPSLDTKELADQLTMLGLEVDSVVPAAALFSGVVVGEVIAATPHPKAKRLHCCKVNIATGDPLDIVCGGVNVRAGIRVPVATVGAQLPGDIIIKRTEIRGMPSEGMICSSSELDLGEGPAGSIMELRTDAPIGKDFCQYLALDDAIIDIELTPNRADCLSIRGISRDLAVVNRIKPQEHPIIPQPVTADDVLPIELQEPQACPHYVGRILRDIKTDAVLPVWMEERLRRSGIRVIHPVVDVLNYVMLEIGQPMHAFDLEQFNDKLIVRFPQEGERLTLLDGQEVGLDKNSLLIADTKQPLAIAGVIGGLDSSVSETTRHIFLESAFFEPIGIRQSARFYGLQTDASYRFERGVDYTLQLDAIERATELLLAIVGGKAGPVITASSAKEMPKQHSIHFRASQVQRLLGISLERGDIENILSNLGMELQPVEGGWMVTVPSYRFDLEQEVDLIEEVARIYGYDRIPAKPLVQACSMLEQPEEQLNRSHLAAFLVDRGYHEAITYSFIAPEMQLMFAPDISNLALSNPIASDMAVMRASLWPGLLKAIQYNQHRQISRVRLFERGLVFLSDEEGACQQEAKLAMVVSGSAYPEQWGLLQRSVDFYDLKGEVDAMFAPAAVHFHWEVATHPALHPGQTAALYYRNHRVGYLGTLHPSLLQKLDLNGSVCCFEVELAAIENIVLPQFKEISKFPFVRRDIAVIVDQAVSGEEITQSIRKKTDQLLVNVDIFDVYQGTSVEKGKKSIALGLTFQDPSRTLIDAEIDEVIQSVVVTLGRDFNAKLRA